MTISIFTFWLCTDPFMAQAAVRWTMAFLLSSLGNTFPMASLRTDFESPNNMDRCGKNAVSAFNRGLLARILIYWVGSFNGRIEDVGLTRMVMNGNG